MESKQSSDAKSNIIAIVSYVMAGLALVSVIVFISQKFSSESKVAVLREQGNAYVKAADYESAIAAYSEAIAIDSDNKDINCRLKYAQLMNDNTSVSISEQDAADNSSDTNEDAEPESADTSNADVSVDDPLGLGEEGLCGLTWNDMFRDDAEEYIKNYAVNESGIEYDDCYVSDDGSRASYQTGDNNPDYYWLSVDDHDITWLWEYDPGIDDEDVKISLSYYSAWNELCFSNVSPEKCRFFGLSRKDFINNELLANDISYTDGDVTQDGKPYGKAVIVDFKSIQGTETRASFLYNLNDELYMLTYHVDK